MSQPANLTLICLILACTISDILHQEVPRLLSIALGVGALVLSRLPWTDRLLGSAGCVLPFVVMYVIRDDLGGADVRFAAACGASLGLTDGLISLASGLLSFIVVFLPFHVIRRLSKHQTGMDRTLWPLIPWLAWPWLLLLFIRVGACARVALWIVKTRV